MKIIVKNSLGVKIIKIGEKSLFMRIEIIMSQLYKAGLGEDIFQSTLNNKSHGNSTLVILKIILENIPECVV